MEALFDLPWRGYPATLLALVGLVLTVRGVRRLHTSFVRPRTDAWTPLIYLQGFRLTIWGLTLVALAAAWTWQLTWLLAIALVIGGEETLECSTTIFVLQRSLRATVGGDPATQV